jgi:hypothetical protein
MIMLETENMDCRLFLKVSKTQKQIVKPLVLPKKNE